MWRTAAAIGLPVFPCRADKTPACPHGFKDAVAEPKAIERLFANYPAELIGVPTGKISGIDVLDIDSPRHPEADKWARDQAPVLQTRAHRTRSGGLHFLFNHAPGLRNWTSRPVEGVDGRADGGYIVFWPAIGFPHNSRTILDWPSSLLSLFAAKEKPRPSSATPPPPINDAKLAGVARTIAFAANGTRNDILFWGACRITEWIVAGDLPRRVGEAVLMAAARQAGLPDIEAQRTIWSAFSRGSDADPA